MAHTVSGLWVGREEKGAGFKANQGSHYCSQTHSAGKFMLSDREPGRLDLGVRTPLRMVPGTSASKNNPEQCLIQSHED